VADWPTDVGRGPKRFQPRYFSRAQALSNLARARAQRNREGSDAVGDYRPVEGRARKGYGKALRNTESLSEKNLDGLFRFAGYKITVDLIGLFRGVEQGLAGRRGPAQRSEDEHAHKVGCLGYAVQAGAAGHTV